VKAYLKNNQGKKGWGHGLGGKCLPTKHKTLSANLTTTEKNLIPKKEIKNRWNKKQYQVNRCKHNHISNPLK
jgi:hypothetical protein